MKFSAPNPVTPSQQKALKRVKRCGTETYRSALLFILVGGGMTIYAITGFIDPSTLNDLPRGSCFLFILMTLLTAAMGVLFYISVKPGAIRDGVFVKKFTRLTWAGGVLFAVVGLIFGLTIPNSFVEEYNADPENQEVNFGFKLVLTLVTIPIFMAIGCGTCFIV